MIDNYCNPQLLISGMNTDAIKQNCYFDNVKRFQMFLGINIFQNYPYPLYPSFIHQPTFPLLNNDFFSPFHPLYTQNKTPLNIQQTQLFNKDNEYFHEDSTGSSEHIKKSTDLYSVKSKEDISNPKEDNSMTIKMVHKFRKQKRNQKEKASELLEDSFLRHLGRKEFYPLHNMTKLYQKKAKEKRNPYTKILFHLDYKQTSSMEDFMKYNFNFIQEEQYKTEKLITEPKEQHVHLLKKDNEFFLMRKREIKESMPKRIWSNEIKAKDSEKKLLEMLQLIEQKWPIKDMKFNEEIGLDIIKINNFSKGKLKSFLKRSNFINYIRKDKQLRNEH